MIGVDDGMGLSAAEAARRTGAARSTVQRALKRGDFPGARQTARGWMIPVADLLQAGFEFLPEQGGSAPVARQQRGQQHATGATANEAVASHAAAEAESLRAELAQARHDLEIERAHRRTAEAIAAERERLVETQALALRMLEPAQEDEAPVAPQPEPSSESVEHRDNRGKGARAKLRMWWKGA